MGILRLLGIGACKGLHCAGCGKGIPGGIGLLGVIILLAIAGSKHMAGLIGQFLHFLEMALLTVAIGAAICSVIVVLGIRAITRVWPVMGMSWEGKTQCEIKADADEYGELVPQWPNMGRLQITDTQPIPVITDAREPAYQDTWT